MRFTYNFIDNIDYINSEKLNIQSFKSLNDEIKKLNEKYGYDIYIYGSYLSYLINKTQYNDINFIALLNEKMINLDDLTEFMKSFHQLAKKYKIGYDLKFSLDLSSDMINTNKRKNTLFNGEISIISLYEYKNNEEKLKNIQNSELFTGVWSSERLSDKIIRAMRKNVNFNIPVKIS
jgi:hypothetical protein